MVLVGLVNKDYSNDLASYERQLGINSLGQTVYQSLPMHQSSLSWWNKKFDCKELRRYGLLQPMMCSKIPHPNT
jgi:hypothetical protein